MKTLCSIAVVGLMLLLMAVPCAEAAQDGHDLLGVAGVIEGKFTVSCN